MNGEKNIKKDFLLPASILIAALLVSGALVYNAGRYSNGGDKGSAQILDSAQVGGSAANVAPVTTADHIYGNPNAEIKVITFTDYECPFCKDFHKEMKKALAEYGSDIAWIYRNFPLDELHSKARKEAYAAECAGNLGGNAKFWTYVDKIFEVTPSNNGLDLSLLPDIAEEIGIDRGAFQTCLNQGSEKYDERINNSISDGIGAGAGGTPFSVVLVNGNAYEIPGAFPFESQVPGQRNSIKGIIDSALDK